MRLLEYEAKELLRRSGLAVPASAVYAPDSDTFDVSPPLVVKSQVPVGGRGKAGGIVFVDDVDHVHDRAAKLFDLPIGGYLPQKLLVEERLDVERELYLSLTINRDTGTIDLMAHPEGGIDIESQHEGFYKADMTDGSIDGQKLAKAIDLHSRASELTGFVKALYASFVSSDATVIEINPLVITKKGSLVCADAKIELDDAAAFRHKWQYEQTPQQANFVQLDQQGTVATMANGAGLAMATVDAVADAGFSAANFLDIGGGASAESVLGAFKSIKHDYPAVRAIIINVFAGITKCDEVAKAIVEALAGIDELPPLYIRLSGTRYAEAEAILNRSNIPLYSSLDECVAAMKAQITIV